MAVAITCGYGGYLLPLLAAHSSFCMEETWEHVYVHWQQGNYPLWANCFMWWNPVANAGLRVSRQLCHPLLCWVSLPLGHDLSVKKWTGTSRMVSHNRHNNEPTLSMNDSPLGCVHLTVVYRYYFCNFQNSKLRNSWHITLMLWKCVRYIMKSQI